MIVENCQIPMKKQSLKLPTIHTLLNETSIYQLVLTRKKTRIYFNDLN